MDRELIIRLAREAGVKPLLYDGKWAVENLDVFAALVAAEKDKEIKMLAKALKAEQKKNKELINIMPNGLEIAVKLAVKAEREECAKVAEEWFTPNLGGEATAAIAAAIRSRTLLEVTPAQMAHADAVGSDAVVCPNCNHRFKDGS